MTAGSRIGILGGTFDPMHLGHVEAARAARSALRLERIVVVPSHAPPHRQNDPVASAFHRFAMAALYSAQHEWMAVSDDELRAGGPSFTADTLERLSAAGVPRSQMFFITGADAFAEIETWHRYPEVLELAHFAVVSRPGLSVNGLAERLPALQSRFVPPTNAGRIGAAPSVFLVDALTPDISSTDVRRRLGNGEPVTGLVSQPVEQHIRRHHLYALAS